MNVRDWLKHAHFQFTLSGKRELRAWALFVLSVFLAAVWKMLLEIDKLFDNNFWLVVFGATPIQDLGPYGFIMLAIYIPGVVLWWIVTALLFRINQDVVLV